MRAQSRQGRQERICMSIEKTAMDGKIAEKIGMGNIEEGE